MEQQRIGRVVKRLWLGISATLFLALLFLSNYDERWAVDLVRSIVNGETSIGFWVKHGLGFGSATGIAMFCSTYDIFTWFYMFNSIRDGWNRMDSLVVQFFRNHIEKAARKGKWGGRFWWLAEKTYKFCIPQPGNVFENCDLETTRRPVSCYYPLPFYGLCPGYIWTGVGYSITFRLNISVAFSILVTFNALKMVAARYLTQKIGIWGVFALVITMPFTKFGIEKFLKFVSRKK